MAVVSIDERDRLLAMGYTEGVIERTSRAGIDIILSDPDLKLTLLDEPSASISKQLAGFDPEHGTGGILAALSAALDPGEIADDITDAARNILDKAKTIIDPKSWMIVGGITVVVLLLWKR